MGGSIPLSAKSESRYTHKPSSGIWPVAKDASDRKHPFLRFLRRVLYGSLDLSQEEFVITVNSALVAWPDFPASWKWVLSLEESGIHSAIRTKAGAFRACMPVAYPHELLRGRGRLHVETSHLQTTIRLGCICGEGDRPYHLVVFEASHRGEIRANRIPFLPDMSSAYGSASRIAYASISRTPLIYSTLYVVLKE